MKLENFVSEMMSINVYSRLCHWATSSAQHHTTFEAFLTQNEQLTDSFVESALGNDLEFATDKIEVKALLNGSYDLNTARDRIKSYRANINKVQQEISKNNPDAEGELVSILDDLIELCSKTLYLLKLR